MTVKKNSEKVGSLQTRPGRPASQNKNQRFASGNSRAGSQVGNSPWKYANGDGPGFNRLTRPARRQLGSGQAEVASRPDPLTRTDPNAGPDRSPSRTLVTFNRITNRRGRRTRLHGLPRRRADCVTTLSRRSSPGYSVKRCLGLANPIPDDQRSAWSAGRVALAITSPRRPCFPSLK